jgi:AraC-like DNA-binding protein/quercetin dioxygenase-like cupin family protein
VVLIPRLGEVQVDRRPISATDPLFVQISTHSAESGIAGADLHRHFEFGILLRGRMEMSFEEVTLELVPGDVWLVPGYEAHAWRFPGSGAADHIWIHFDLLFLPEKDARSVPWLSMFATPAQDRRRARSPEARRQLLAIGREMAREAQERLPLWEEAIRLALLRCFVILYREEGGDMPLVAGRSATNKLGQIMPAVELIHAKTSQRIDLKSAAAACGFQQTYFSRLFRQTMGVTFARFQLRARLLRGAHLLATSHSPVAAIAEETGFADESHFHRRFAEVYGCSPGEYRRRTQPP